MTRSPLRAASSVLYLILAAHLPPVFAADTEPAAKTPGFEQVLRDWTDLSVGEEAVAVKDLRIEYGHLVLTLASGAAAPVRAGERVVGLFLSGEGQFRYVSVDPIEFPVVKFNLDKATRYHHEQKDNELSFAHTFKQALVCVAGRDLAPLEGAPAESLKKRFENHRAHFQNDSSPPGAHAFAMHHFNAPSSLLVRVELGGGYEDLVYVHDEALERREMIYNLRRVQSRDRELKDELRPSVLSEQLIGRGRKDLPKPAFELTAVDLTLVASDGKDAAISVEETIVPRRDGLAVLRFDLDSRRFAWYRTGVLDRREIRVKSVTDGAGKPLAFSHVKHELIVALGAPAPRGKPLALRFEIEGDFLIRPEGDSYWQLGPGSWFPQPELAGQMYSWHATIKVKKPFVAFTAGQTVRRETEGDYSVLEARTDRPLMFAAVLAGKYDFSEETRNGLTVRVASYAGLKKDSIRKLTDLTFGIVSTYEHFLGPFPFPEFNIVEINSYGFGQAPPGLMFITREVFSPIEGLLSKLYSQGANERFAHEIAHQYWGQVVKMPSWEEQWITESFAEYSAAIMLRKLKGEDSFKALAPYWKASAKEAIEAAPIPLANRISVPLDQGVAFDRRNSLLYDKGSYLLWALHRELGDQAFLTFLKSSQTSMRWMFGTTERIRQVLEAVTKKDYTAFFDRYYWGTGMPE